MKHMPPTAKPNSTPIHIVLENDLLGEIEDFRFKNRFHTRIETLKALLRLGLQNDKGSRKPNVKAG